MLIPEPCAFYIMDKAYVDFEALFRSHQAQAFWVSRPKENMKFKTIGQLKIPDAKSRIIEDARINYKSPYSITKVATLIRISALERTELRALLTRQDPAIISNQNVKELSLFDDV